MYHFFKILFRLMDYTRGFYVFLLINACGGKCSSIPKVGKKVVFKYPPHKGFSIGKNCEIGSFVQFDVPLHSKLQIGDRVKLTNMINISVSKHVSIGNNVLIAEGVSIRDSQHNFMESMTSINSQGLEVGSIHIADDVWLGKNSMLLLNVNIHKGCILGANSLLKNKTTEDYAVYIGSPAKKIKSRI